jgi:hypothetical protein
MLTRREALLGTLLAPLIKPVVGMLPKKPKDKIHQSEWLQDTVVHWDYSVIDLKGRTINYTVWDDPVTGLEGKINWVEEGFNHIWEKSIREAFEGGDA